MPTLDLYDAAPPETPVTPNPAHVPVPGMTPPAAPTHWAVGFVAALDGELDGPAFAGVPAAERAMLGLVRDELRQLPGRPAGASAVWVLVSILAAAEHVTRTERPGESHPYGFALRAVERGLDASDAADRPAWGTAPASPAAGPAPSLVARAWQRVLGG